MLISDFGWELFFLCDLEGKGYIMKVDLGWVVDDLSLNFEQFDFIFDKFDIDKNGCLMFDEFVEGFGVFFVDGNNGLLEFYFLKYDVNLKDDFIKEGLLDGYDIFESLEVGLEFLIQVFEDVLF